MRIQLHGSSPTTISPFGDSPNISRSSPLMLTISTHHSMPPTTTTQEHDNPDLLSRMRAHKGNVPSLPQTKYCSLCPAKFTRTTHLNRHLRSHTNERLHRCNLCKSSEFTRSDLLIRHKRTCGQSVNRSRRKSCEACAESKIKCNLEYPCAKCTSRGRECVFLNDPEESRNKSLSSKTTSRKSTPQPVERSAPPTPPPSPKMPSTPVEGSSRATSSSPSSYFLALPALSESGTSSEVSSSQSSPRSESFQTFDDRQPFDFSLDGGYVAPALSSLSLSPFDQPLFPSLPSTLFDGTKVDALEGGGALTPALSVDEDLDLFASMINSAEPPPPPSGPVSSGNGHLPMSQPPITLDFLDARDVQYLSGATSTLDMYLHLFFTRFLAQVPLIHAGTWKMAETPPTLMRIFHACGALFVQTPEAAVFVETTITAVTAEISEEFSTVHSRLANDTSHFDSVSRHRIHLIIALVLLQTICVFLRQSGTKSNPQHHAMLVTMIRQTGLIKRVGTWSAPHWSDPMSLEAAWVEWVQFETLKRALLFAYFHDCCHCMYDGAPPAFSPAELAVHLPCDEALWRARSSTEWLAVVHTPSAYGVGIEQIHGVGMQRALESLAIPPDANPDNSLARRLPLTPFALFLLIHTVLRNISVAQRPPPPGGWSCFAMVAAQAPSGTEFTFRTQLMLDNWLQLWLSCPEAALPAQDNGSGGQEPPYVCNSLPFYWLAQVSLWENSWAGPALEEPGDISSKSFQTGQWVG
ncbi:fungal-specific transcription factor domain-containing protein [Mycena capillaripes]|nr:fungal-specific transcription factor domain-containing protein [Mycena capillaripes]